ncbi:MAG: S49 family peptidase [Candidatus Wallbacteria bacterium]|nr:S49 family peptidase [Candidatus Wallbacteria bacterium]
MELNQIAKFIFKVFAMAFFAMICFFVMVFMFSLLFIGAGIGISSGISSLNIHEAAPEKTAYEYLAGSSDSKNLLLQIDVEGLILGRLPAGLDLQFEFMGVSAGYDIKETLQDAALDDNIKGVILRLQTPGGTIFGSMAIFDGVKEFQEKTKKPVLAYVEGMSASGGLMAMAGSDAIYADYGSLVGSIGILGPEIIYYNKPMATDGGIIGGGIVTQGGIESNQIHAGRGKDFGNPFRKATEEELSVMQQGLDAEYDNFVAHVARNRKIAESVIRETMGAHIFDNKTAKELGLIDGTLDYHSCLDKLASLSKVGSDYKVVIPREPPSKYLEHLFNICFPGRMQSSKESFRKYLAATIFKSPLAFHGDLEEISRDY